MKKVCIIYNHEEKIAQELFIESIKYFQKRKIKVLENNIEEADFLVVIGEDRTLLNSFKYFVFKENFYIIAINIENAGFLVEIKKENMIREYDNFLNNDFDHGARHILEIKLKDRIYYALNEIVISKAEVTSKILKVSFTVNDEYMCTYKSDGVIVSTPTGSTAYSMSAGGPILNPNIKAIVITPIAPHNLSTRSIVISGEEELKLQIKERDRDGKIIVDGQISERIDSSTIINIKYLDIPLNFVTPKNRSYYNILREKLNWEGNLC